MPLQTIPYSEGDDRNFIPSRDVDNFDDVIGRCGGHIYCMGRTREISVRGGAIGLDR